MNTRNFDPTAKNPSVIKPASAPERAFEPESWLQGQALQAALAFWKKQLGDFLPLLELPTDRARLALPTYHGQTHRFTLPPTLIESLRVLCREIDATLFDGLFAIYQILLYRYTGQEDFIVAAPARSARNTILLRADTSGNPTFRELLTRSRQWMRAAHEHDTLPLAQLGRELFPQQNLNQLFQTALALHNGVASAHANGEPEKLELALTLAETAQGWEGTFTYNADLFDAATMARLAGHYETLLRGAVEHPDTRIALLPILPAEEYKQIVVDWNATQVEFPNDACLHELFEKQAEKLPDKIAVVFKDEQITYGELNRRANRLAHYLQRLGVGPDVLAGVYMERSLEMVIGLYGILKAGGAYVPLDPSYPASRLAFMLEDTQVAVLLTQTALIENLKFPIENLKLICLDTALETIAHESDAKPESAVTAGHLAYVIYTSGSTGRPKGAVLNHRGRVSNFCDFNWRYNIGVNDRLIGLASLSFDMSAYDIFGTLMTGGTIVIVEGEAILEPGRWAELMVHHDITVWHSVPALLEMLVNHCNDRPEISPRLLRLVLLGGDWIPVSLPDRLKGLIPGVHVVSMGGATEVSMDSTIYDIVEPSSKWKSIPYGVPMMNQLSYVLDEYLQPLPIGVPCELHLGGVGVGRGYFNRPDLTAQKFIPNPFSGMPGDRMYKTGDLARYRPDSNLELLGRMDFQVKIRGYRIELGEIISALTKHPAVKEAVVVAKEDFGVSAQSNGKPGQAGTSKRLVAYVVPDLQYHASASSAQRASTGSALSGAEVSEWQSEQIAQWEKIYDKSYGEETAGLDPTFNITTWNSSYTGLPIPGEEMREWVNQSVDRILKLPRSSAGPRVLEIACGTGLILFKIAPHSKKYWGVDLSKEALAYIRRQLAKPEYALPQVELFHRMADNFDGVPEQSFDLVILHSVVQLFPSVDYLVRVLAGAIKTVAPGGSIFIGDVISLALFEAFRTSVQLHQSPASLRTEKLRQRVKKAMAQEEQMFLAPEFFQALQQQFPQISHAQIQPRRGRFDNEMTRYRYDVILHINKKIKTQTAYRWLDWTERRMTLPLLRRLLQDEQPETAGFLRVPNARLAVDMKIRELLAKPDGPQTAGELREGLQTVQKSEFVDPEDLWAIGNELPYDVDLAWSEEIGCCDVLFKRRRGESSSSVPVFPGAAIQAKPWNQYANNPLQSVLTRQLVPQLRRDLQKRLPEYMVPTAFVLLEALPLSPNGKIDRRALPAPDQSRPELQESYVAPRNPVEEVVAQIWTEVFGFEAIGMHDNFLELGGHSLLATQIMTRLQDIFPVDLPMTYFFGAPTVAELSARLIKSGDEAQIDISEIARTLLQVNRLSDEQVTALLAEQK